MKRLPKDWLTQGWIDVEYKKFIVLAYLQGVGQRFSDKMLFPDLTDLHEHYETGVGYQRRKGWLASGFPRDLTGIDPQTLSLQFTSRHEEDEYIQQVDAIMNFALPRFRQARDEGQEMAADIEAGLKMEPVGMMPLRRDEGYLFLHWTARPDTHIYYFSLTLYTGSEARLVRTNYIESVRRNLGMTFEGLKRDLIRRRPGLPNPATYLVESKREVPLDETFLPMAERLVGREC